MNERRREAWWEALQRHKDDEFAHGKMMARTETDTQTRLGSLERFKAQATVIGAIALVVLGAVSYAVFEQLVKVGH